MFERFKDKQWRTGASLKMYKAGFWMLIVFLFGVFCGNWYTNKLISVDLNNAYRLGGIVINDTVYTITKKN